MKTRIFILIGLALFVGGPGPGRSLANSAAPESGTVAGSDARCDCCPHCGCRLVAVCNVCCTTKKVTEYKYRCTSSEMCTPSVTPLCKRHASCGECCENDCRGRCAVREVKQLVKVPVTKEVPVRTCTVQWVCPNNCGENTSQATAAPTPVPPAAKAPPAPLPKPAGGPLPRPKDVR